MILTRHSNEIADLDSAFVKELEENKYIVKYIEKPDLIEIVASTIS